MDTSLTDHSHNNMGHDSHDSSMHTEDHNMASNILSPYNISSVLNLGSVLGDIASQGQGYSDTSYIGMAHSGMAHSGMDHSGMDHSGMDHSGMDHSGMDHSGMDHSGMDHRGMDHSGMDHSAMNHGGMVHGSGHMMNMTFHGGSEELILFSWWKTTDAAEFVGSFFAIFIMALLYEGLKYYRKHLLWKTYTGLQYCAVSPPDKGVANICAPDEPQVIQPVPHTLERNVPSMLSTAHAWQTVLHGIQVLVSYMLMLVFMTYNVWLCAAVVFGSATGYFLFGWRESVVVDFTEHCH